VLALGSGPDARPWRVGIRDPFSDEVEAEFAQVELTNQALSSSAVFGSEPGKSDLINPLNGLRLNKAQACVVIGNTGATTEALSTAFLCMGKKAAVSSCEKSIGLAGRLGWIAPGEDGPKLEWWT
jgi:thiamine biosynthesis lipoprotein ApbE